MMDATDKGLHESADLSAVIVEEDLEALLCFRVLSTWLAVPAKRVEEICDANELTPIPQAPSHIPGLFNLRGHAIPILDVTRFLGLQVDAGQAAEAEASGRIVVINSDGMRVGIQCQQVRGVVEVAPEEMKSRTVVEGSRLAEYAAAEVEIGNGLHVLLNLTELFARARVGR